MELSVVMVKIVYFFQNSDGRSSTVVNVIWFTLSYAMQIYVRCLDYAFIVRINQ